MVIGYISERKLIYFLRRFFLFLFRGGRLVMREGYGWGVLFFLVFFGVLFFFFLI